MGGGIDGYLERVLDLESVGLGVELVLELGVCVVF